MLYEGKNKDESDGQVLNPCTPRNKIKYSLSLMSQPLSSDKKKSATGRWRRRRTKPTMKSVAEDDSDQSMETCLVCTETIKYFAIAECNHEGLSFYLLFLFISTYKSI
jgi:hypothetical protein